MFVGNYDLIHILELVKDAETIAIAGHVNPDGDCIGSTLAMYNYLKHTGKTIDVYLEPIGREFKELPGSDVIKNKAENKVYDVFFMMDLGDTERIGVASKLFETAKKTICIDHHITSKGVADENFIFPSLSSTCELVFEMMDVELISKDVAACLYTGIIHDTCLLYTSPSPRD